MIWLDICGYLQQSSSRVEKENDIFLGNKNKSNCKHKSQRVQKTSTVFTNSKHPKHYQHLYDLMECAEIEGISCPMRNVMMHSLETNGFLQFLVKDILF